MKSETPEVLKSLRTAIGKDLDSMLKRAKKKLELADIARQLDGLVKSAEREMNRLITSNAPKLTARLKGERKKLEKRIDKTIRGETRKAKKFLAQQKKELQGLQDKVEKEVRRITASLTKKPPRKVRKKKTTRKKTTVRKKTTQRS